MKRQHRAARAAADQALADWRADLRAARRAAGLTQAQAADAIGMAQPLWSAYERGAKAPSLRQAALMAAAVGLRLPP